MPNCECGRIFTDNQEDGIWSIDAHRTTCMYARIADLQKELAKKDLQIRQNEEASQSRKARCVEKCNHPADFVCDYEDGTSHCLECVAEKFWQLEDILSGKHNVHTYHGALETIAHPERFLTKYDPVQVAKDALKEKRNDANDLTYQRGLGEVDPEHK